MAFSDSTDGTGSTPRRSPRLLAKRSILTPVRKRLIKFVKKKEESQSGTKLASFDLDEFRNYCDDVAVSFFRNFVLFRFFFGGMIFHV